MADFEPKQFGKYFLIEKLAVGGMAEIYKAKTYGVDGFEKLLVVKRILPHCCADKDFITMLVDEAKLSVTLSHANVVQVYDLGKVGDDYFISMEYISGVNLRDIIYRCKERGMTIPDELATYIISEVCKGLDYAHRKTDAGGTPLNIVHRDVSPQNILISYEGEVKIVDFGIAKAAMNISHTMAGILKGKIAYMSPEQALGKTVDYRADIFSAGIVLFETLTLDKLFTGESQFEVLKKIRSTKIDTSKLPENIPDGLKPILSKGLAYYSKDRYQSAGDMQIDLTRYLYTTHIDFTPQKLAGFIKELFSEEIAKQRERGVREKVFEAQTSSINIAEEALQENLVHREETSPTGQTDNAADAGSSTAIEATDKTAAKRPLSQKLIAAAGIAALLAGIGFAYARFIHPLLTVKGGDETAQTAGTSGTIVIKSTPEGAAIFLDNNDSGLTTPAIIEKLSIGKTYSVKLVKDGFVEYMRDIEVVSSKPLALDTALEQALGVLEVSSEPEGAEIFIDGSPAGERTPFTIKGLGLNTDHKITLKKENYKDLDQTVNLNSYKPQRLTAKLLPAPLVGTISLTTTPAGVSVFLNGRDTMLVTPTKLENVPIGEKQSIRLVRNGFETATEVVTLKDTSPFEIRTELKPVSKPVEEVSGAQKEALPSLLVSTTPPGAKIMLDGRATGLKTPTTLKDLEVGKSYSIRFEKTGFEPMTKEYTIANSGPLSVSERLKKAETPVTRPEEAAKTPPPVKEPEAKPRAPEPSGPTYGEGAAKASLRVASNPSGAEIFINGEYKGTTPATISDIKPGSVSLLVSKEGKSRFSQRISLSPGESKDMGTLKLAGLYGSVSINTSPAGAKVYFDGDEIGARTPLTIKKVQRDKAHSLRLVLDGYQDWQSNFEMGNEDEKKFNVTMEK